MVTGPGGVLLITGPKDVLVAEYRSVTLVTGYTGAA